MSNLAYRQAEMRARAISVISETMKQTRAVKDPSVIIPKTHSLPCPVHPDAIGMPSAPNRCAECLRVSRRARTRRGEVITLYTRYKAAKYSAKNRGIPFTLTFKEYRLVMSAPCVYQYNRALPQARTGIDRIDSTKGYVSGNCQPCCALHNLMKSDFWTHGEMRAIMRIYPKPCGNKPSKKQYQ